MIMTIVWKNFLHQKTEEVPGKSSFDEGILV